MDSTVDTSRPLVPWGPEQAAGFGAGVHVAPHGLAERGDLLDDAALAGLLDRLPASATHIYTMGTDPADRTDWRQGDRGALSGTELLRAVQNGRLWLNLLRVQDHDPAWAETLDQLVAGLRGAVPHLDVVRASATVLVSSPTAFVHYHADPQPNLLWHCRGRKRVLVWPALDPRFVPYEDLQAIFTGEAHEQLPYTTGSDSYATVVDLEPGWVASWPQNAGHRVENVEGLNVSLSVEYATPATLRRERVWGANRLLSTRFHLPVASVRETGPLPAVKAASFRVLRTVWPPVPRDHSPTFLVDPDSPLGVGPLVPVPR